jgi:hypothetical protein
MKLKYKASNQYIGPWAFVLLNRLVGEILLAVSDCNINDIRLFCIAKPIINQPSMMLTGHTLIILAHSNGILWDLVVITYSSLHCSDMHGLRICLVPFTMSSRATRVVKGWDNMFTSAHQSHLHHGCNTSGHTSPSSGTQQTQKLSTEHTRKIRSWTSSITLASCLGFLSPQRLLAFGASPWGHEMLYISRAMAPRDCKLVCPLCGHKMLTSQITLIVVCAALTCNTCTCMCQLLTRACRAAQI